MNDWTISPVTERLLRLSYMPGVGTSTLRKLVARMQDPAFSDKSDESLTAGIVTENRAGKQNRDGWKTVVSDCETEEIQILSPLDAKYPRQLLTIEDYPPLLYVKGSADAMQPPAAAVVGTREASRLGLSWARQIAELLSQNGYSVVSGLALGIDTAAHEGALRAAGRTVAVLAHGLDQITPASNRDLADKILAQGGALVSEHPPKVPPRRPEYVRRNRIQSGLSLCSIVVESGEQGGAIHQGNFTKKQRRRLFCVVPDANLPGASEFKYEGANRLMQEAGAIPLRSRADLFQEIGLATVAEESAEQPVQFSFL